MRVIQFDDFAVFARADLHQRAVVRKHVELAGELASPEGAHQRLSAPSRRAYDPKLAGLDDEERGLALSLRHEHIVATHSAFLPETGHPLQMRIGQRRKHMIEWRLWNQGGLRAVRHSETEMHLLYPSGRPQP